MPEGEKFGRGAVVIGGHNLPSPGWNRGNWSAKYWGGQWPPWPPCPFPRFRHHCSPLYFVTSDTKVKQDTGIPWYAVKLLPTKFLFKFLLKKVIMKIIGILAFAFIYFIDLTRSGRRYRNQEIKYEFTIQGMNSNLDYIKPGVYNSCTRAHVHTCHVRTFQGCRPRGYRGCHGSTPRFWQII